MAVNVPLIHISELQEQTTAADTDCMVIGGADVKKIKWSTIVSLIKTKLGIGEAATKAVANNLTTESAGAFLLDAHQGKVLKEKIEEVSAYLSDYLKIVDATTANITLSGGQGKNVSVTKPTVSGYKYLATLDVIPNGDAAMITHTNGWAYNPRTSAVTINYIHRMLYVRDV